MPSRECYIKVGMTACLTGRYGHLGSQALAGARAWVEDTNRSGGVRLKGGKRRLPVRLIHYDDGSGARRCAELTRRLIVEDQVNILLGPYSSGLSLRAAGVAREHERVLWNHGGASEASYQLGSPWVVDILSPASTYFHGIIDMACHTQPAVRSVAIVHSMAGAFPREVASGAERHCREMRFEDIRTYRYEAGTTDFDPIIRQLCKDRPDVVLAVGRIEDDIRFAQQIVHSGLNATTLGLVATPLTLFRERLGDAADGFFGPSQWEPGIGPSPDYGPSSAQVIASLAGRGAVPVDYPMAQAYAGCLIAQRCIEEAGSLDNRALREVAGELDFTTFYGRFRIEPTTGRQVGHVMPVVQWRHGKKVVLWPPGMRPI